LLTIREHPFLMRSVLPIDLVFCVVFFVSWSSKLLKFQD